MGPETRTLELLSGAQVRRTLRIDDGIAHRARLGADADARPDRGHRDVPPLRDVAADVALVDDG
jgi:hypothetical protein